MHASQVVSTSAQGVSKGHGSDDALWIGKEVESRVPLACGMVRGVVRDITHRGQVVFVYTPRLNKMSVVVMFPLERIGDVLAVGHVAA